MESGERKSIEHITRTNTATWDDRDDNESGKEYNERGMRWWISPLATESFPSGSAIARGHVSSTAQLKVSPMSRVSS